MSLGSIWRAFRRVKYRKTSKNISQYSKRRHLIIYLLSNSKKFSPGVKILGFKSNRRHQDFAKSKIYTNHSNQNILEGVIFWWVQILGAVKSFRATKTLAFAMVIMFLTFLGLGIKLSRWGKNSLGGVKIHQVGTSETVRYVRSNSWHLQFNLCVLVYLRLCYTWPWKDEQKYWLIFLLVLRYFFLSCKNLTITQVSTR